MEGKNLRLYNKKYFKPKCGYCKDNHFLLESCYIGVRDELV